MASFNLGAAIAALAPTLSSAGVPSIVTGGLSALAAGFTPGAPVQAMGAVMAPTLQAAPVSTEAPEGTSQGFGEKFINVAGKALSRYRQFEALPVQQFDVISLGQGDDRELAKLLISRGAIPADSDLGRGAQLAGAKPSMMTVRYSDGSSERISVIKIGKGGGGSRAYNYTPRRGKIAARIMRSALREVKQLRRLGVASAVLQRVTHPKPRIEVKGKGKR